MRATLRLICVLGLCGSGLLQGAEPPKPEEIEQWVKDLGAEEFTVRNTATDKLLNAGDAGKAELEKLAQGDNAKLKARADLLLKALKSEPILRKMDAALVDAKDFSADVTSLMTIRYRTESKGKMKITADGTRYILDDEVNDDGKAAPVHTVSDGDNVWSERTNPEDGSKEILKFKLETMQKISASNQPMLSLHDLRARFIFSEMKEVKLNGKAAYILEGPMREGIAEVRAKTIEEIAGKKAAARRRAQWELVGNAAIYVAAQDYFPVKLEVRGKNGEILICDELSNIQTNIKIDPAEFKYAPPDGAKLTDMEELFKRAREQDKAE